MYYLLYVELDHFYAGRFEPTRATVVHQKGLVLDCSEAARARRVRPGTALTEAKAILRGDAAYVEFREADYVSARDEWLDVCLLYSSGIEYASPSCAWIDMSRHPSPVDVAGRLVMDLWNRFGLPIRAGMGPTRWIARLAALPCDCGGLVIEVPCVAHPGMFLSSLPTRLLEPVPYEHRIRLEFLGYRRIGEVQGAALPLLLRQFGRDGLLIHEAAHGRLGDPLCPNYPRTAIECVRRFDGCCSDRYALTSAAGEIGVELTARLRTMDLLAGATETVLELESGLMVRRARRLPKPSDSLVLSLQHQVSQARITEPVAALRVAVPDLRRVPLVQRALDSAERSEALRSAVASVRELCAMYGDETVQAAGRIELPRRQKVLKAWRETNGWR